MISQMEYNVFMFYACFYFLKGLGSLKDSKDWSINSFDNNRWYN